MAKLEARVAGCEEALMLNHKGDVCECTGDNIFVVRRQKLMTPPIDACILEGVTRNVVIEICDELGLECAETAFTRHDVYTADECFLTGTAAELIPVVAVDGRSIGDGKPGKITNQIFAAFADFVRRDDSKID